jgi:hypothetical protein
VESVTAGFRRQGMEQERAQAWIAGNDQVSSALEILLRLFVSPRGGIRRQFLEMEDAIRFAVTAIAASVARPRFEEDGLDVGFEKREIDRHRRWGRICRLTRLLGIRE